MINPLTQKVRFHCAACLSCLGIVRSSQEICFAEQSTFLSYGTELLLTRKCIEFCRGLGFFKIFLPSDTYKKGQSCCINECFYFLGDIVEITPWVGLEGWKKKCDLGNSLQLIHALVVSYNQSVPNAEPDASPGSDNKCVPDRPWVDKAPYKHSSCFVCNKLWKCRAVFLC